MYQPSIQPLVLTEAVLSPQLFLLLPPSAGSLPIRATFMPAQSSLQTGFFESASALGPGKERQQESIAHPPVRPRHEPLGRLFLCHPKLPYMVNIWPTMSTSCGDRSMTLDFTISLHIPGSSENVFSEEVAGA